MNPTDDQTPHDQDQETVVMTEQQDELSEVSETDEADIEVAAAPTPKQRSLIDDESEKLSLADWIKQSQYWAYGFGLVGLVLLVLGLQTIIVIISRPAAFESGSYLPGGGDPGPPPPPPAASEVPQEQVPEQAIQVTSSSTEVIASDNINAENTFTLPVPTISAPSLDVIQKTTDQVQQNVDKAMKASLDARKSGIRDMASAWGNGGGGSGGGGPAGSGRNVRAKFKALMASGSFAGTTATKVIQLPTTYDTEGPHPRNPIMNMVAMLGYFCRQVDAVIDPNVIPLSSPKLFEIKPPFIYMVGYKDFKLTQPEIDNLQKYLMQGGAVWADSGLAGVGSRFDIAFRREMKRVIPDSDKTFKPLPMDHPIYRDPFVFKGPPPGMNFRADPIEALAIDGVIAIIYTPNNYTDMMRLTYPGLDKKAPKMSEADLLNGPDKIFRTDQIFWNERQTFFRNFEPKASEQVYQLSTNIVIHLLKRWDAIVNSP